ncbi:MAG: V-type ATP synthase subunit F [Oscillospiraceae bacterium]
MYKIAVIGSNDSVIGFKALGLDTYPVENSEAARKVLHEITRPAEDEYAIIYIEETMAADMLSDISRYQERPTPAIILIPGREGPIGLGQSALKEAVEKAVGSDIL